jgi:hypothetical protein
MEDAPPAAESRRGLAVFDRVKLLIGGLLAGSILHFGVERAMESSAWALLDFFLVAILLTRMWSISGGTVVLERRDRTDAEAE